MRFKGRKYAFFLRVIQATHGVTSATTLLFPKILIMRPVVPHLGGHFKAAKISRSLTRSILTENKVSLKSSALTQSLLSGSVSLNKKNVSSNISKQFPIGDPEEDRSKKFANDRSNGNASSGNTSSENYSANKINGEHIAILVLGVIAVGLYARNKKLELKNNKLQISAITENFDNMKIAIAAERDYATRHSYWYDDWLLMLALKANHGYEVDIINWQDEKFEPKNYDAIYVSSTWNCPHYAKDFQAWLERCEGDGKKRLINDGTLLKKMFDKKDYMSKLQLNSIFIEPNELQSLKEVVPNDFIEDFVIKPRISADGWHTVRVIRNPKNLEEAKASLSKENESLSDRFVSLEDAEHIYRSILKENRGGVVIQPYNHAVEQKGEYQLVFLNHVFSHAIKKPPGFMNTAAEKRKQVSSSDENLDNLKAFGEAILNRLMLEYKLDAPITRARVDMLVDDFGKSTLCEVELIDPNTNVSKLAYFDQQRVIENCALQIDARVKVLVKMNSKGCSQEKDRDDVTPSTNFQFWRSSTVSHAGVSASFDTENLSLLQLLI